MKIVGWIRVGDKTACGSTVVEGVPNCTSHGRAISFQGAHIACRKNCVIVGGYPCATLPNGRSRVIHGMVTSNGCPVYSTLNDIDGVGNESGEAIAEKHFLNADGEWVPVYAPPKHEDCDYDQHLVFEDQDGQPLEGVPYRLIDTRGAIIAGTTATDGKTQIVAGNDGEALDCAIAIKGEV